MSVDQGEHHEDRANPPNPPPNGRQPEPPVAAALTRRDFAAALLGVGAGVVGSIATGLVTERLSPSLASTNLRIFSEIEWEDPWDGWAFYSTTPIDLSQQPDKFQSDDDQIRYLVERGCVKASPLLIKLHLSRPGSSPAVVTGLQIANYTKMPAVNGARYDSETAGSNDTTVLAINFDSRRPRVVRSNYLEMTELDVIDGLPDAFSQNTITIEPHLTETMLIAANTANGAHEFALDISYLIEGQQYVERIDNAGLPFQLTQHSAETPIKYTIPWYDSIYRFEPVA